MRSHIFNFLSLRQDFKKLIVGKEIESGENRSLGFKIFSKTSLDEIKVPVGILEFVKETFSSA
jgi:hypothetical protein